VLVADTVGGMLASSYSEARSAHNHEEIHTKNSDSRVVFDTQVNVLSDTEAKVASLREVSLPKFVLLDLEPTLQDFFGFGSPNSHMAGDLFIPADSKVTNSVTSLGSDGGLTGKLLQDLGSSGESITGFTNRNVDNQLFDPELAHRVSLGVSHGRWLYSSCLEGAVVSVLVDRQPVGGGWPTGHTIGLVSPR